VPARDSGAGARIPCTATCSRAGPGDLINIDVLITHADIARLRAYRKEWDEDRGVWKDRPRHDNASHGADSFLTFACSGYTPPSVRSRFNRPLHYPTSWMAV
jgi:hypothetical protein